MDENPSGRREEHRSQPSWLNRITVGTSLTSLFSDMSHETTTAMLPLFVATLVGGPIAAAAPIGLIEGASDGASSAIKSYSGYWTDKTGRRTSCTSRSGSRGRPTTRSNPRKASS